MSINEQNKNMPIERDSAASVPDVLHADVERVKAYAAKMSTDTGEPCCVVSIPDTSRLYHMGYRYNAIRVADLEFYRKSGATLVN
jgi:hypothetical protein